MDASLFHWQMHEASNTYDFMRCPSNNVVATMRIGVHANFLGTGSEVVIGLCPGQLSFIALRKFLVVRGVCAQLGSDLPMSVQKESKDSREALPGTAARIHHRNFEMEVARLGNS